MAYQDKWVNGQVREDGYRECTERYEVIRSFCLRYDRPFTVCDIGANMCYFGLRLTEDFPSCTVIAFEFDHFDLRLDHVQKNNAERLLLFKRKITIADLNALSSCCHFDVILALSVLHHVIGPLDAWIKAMGLLGDSVIVELALDDSARVHSRAGYQIPSGIVLGHGESHLNSDVRRPIVLVSDR